DDVVSRFREVPGDCSADLSCPDDPDGHASAFLGLPMTVTGSGFACARGGDVQGSRRVDIAAPQAELPGELVRRRAGDWHAAAVDAVEVVGGAEADQVRRVVASSL